MGSIEVLVNPFPILPHHLTIPTRRHTPQDFNRFASLLDKLAWQLPNYVVFYNGARCGASAPDHAHLQAGSKGLIPIERDWKIYENHLERIYPSNKDEEAELEELGYNPKNGGIFLLKDYACPAFVVQGPAAEKNPLLLNKLMSVMPIEDKRTEPDFNLLSWRHEGGPTAEDYLVTWFFRAANTVLIAIFASGRSKYFGESWCYRHGWIDYYTACRRLRTHHTANSTKYIARSNFERCRYCQILLKNCMVENVKQLHAMKPKPN